ncbi:MAG: hypothetical protein FWG59_05140 [Betaproteobacteria bacterium]|nr:hypothetical protein [Betaproteobacteria bacterium]
MSEIKAIDKLRQICEGASPGPWDSGMAYFDYKKTGHRGDSLKQQVKNAVFIVTSRTVMPLIIDLCEALEWERECLAFTLDMVTLHRLWGNGINELLRTKEAATAAVDIARENLEAI